MNSILVDDDLYKVLLFQAQKQNMEVNALANAAIRAASKIFADMGLRYSQDDVLQTYEEVMKWQS